MDEMGKAIIHIVTHTHQLHVYFYECFMKWCVFAEKYCSEDFFLNSVKNCENISKIKSECVMNIWILQFSYISVCTYVCMIVWGWNY